MDRLFNTCAGITGYLYGKKVKLAPFLTPSTRSHLKCTRDFSVNNESMQILEEAWAHASRVWQ